VLAIIQFRILLRIDKLVSQRDDFYKNGSESFNLLSSLYLNKICPAVPLVCGYGTLATVLEC